MRLVIFILYKSSKVKSSIISVGKCSLHAAFDDFHLLPTTTKVGQSCIILWHYTSSQDLYLAIHYTAKIGLTVESSMSECTALLVVHIKTSYTLATYMNISSKAQGIRMRQIQFVRPHQAK